jgi:hypothetical protein
MTIWRHPGTQFGLVVFVVAWMTWVFFDCHVEVWQLMLAYTILGIHIERIGQYLHWRGILHWHADELESRTGD